MTTIPLLAKFISKLSDGKYYYGSRRFGFNTFKVKDVFIDHKVENQKNFYEIDGPNFLATITNTYGSAKIINFWCDGEQQLKEYLTLCLLAMD